MNLTRNQIIILAAGGLLAVFLIFAFLWGRQNSGNEQLPDVTLNVWGVFDDFSVFRDIFNGYSQMHPNVRINYTLMNPATYEQDLLNALAANRGPDIFMFQNNWLPKHYDKLIPLNESQLPLTTFRNLYPAVVEQDFAPDNVIFALPLYVDTLALLYNRDFFDQKGVALPPATWEEVEKLVPRLKEINQNTGEIFKAAAAIGGSARSINRQSDLLSALFLQRGTEMTDGQFKEARFSGTSGVAALQFYLQFSNPLSPSFTWSDNLHYSIDNFAEGNAAMIFNYAYQIPVMKRKNPFLNLGIAPFPQFDKNNPLAVANYWGFTVSNKSRNPNYAWDLILFVAANEENARRYAKANSHPPALRTLIAETLNDPILGVFARQTLIARSWPQIDNNAIDRVFSEMILAILNNQATPFNALRKAEDEITDLMERRI